MTTTDDILDNQKHYSNPWLVKPDITRLRELFVKYMTVDSETNDMRRKDFNQAIFREPEGYAVFTDTNLNDVMEAFDKAVKELEE